MAKIPSTTQMTPSGVRLIGAGRTACVVCDRDVWQMQEHPGRRGLAGVHGPRASRCVGSHQPGRPFFEAAHLPGWGDLEDHDKAEALMFARKAHWERSFAYAVESYPLKFIHPLLVEVAAIPEGEYVGGGYWNARYATSVVASLGILERP